MSGAHAPHSEETALLFPTGGYLWPGMGADLTASAAREILGRFESALEPCGVRPGRLFRLMEGEGQARREWTGTDWTWIGDFPLSMVAQTALGVALARARIESLGPPRALAGESMGELAAYCVAGVLTVEETALLTFRWARDLQIASDQLGLRMAVLEDVPEPELESWLADIPARIVVADAPGLLVVALPRSRLSFLDVEARRRGGRILVSNNPCAAHDPQLAAAPGIWTAHEEFLQGLDFRSPTIPLWSTLDPGEMLHDPKDLQANRRETTVRRVHWGETLMRMASAGIRHFEQFGPSASGYPLKRLRRLETSLQHVRISLISTEASALHLRGRPTPPGTMVPRSGMKSSRGSPA
ncbi:MAG TPA: acyltransferase domain-containing protein [Spirochaetia bacterium]|nr:acyltransferase domain-containing protein [Spirochaetia bacterium]